MSFIEIMETVLGKKAEKIFMPMLAGDVKRTWADTQKLEKITNYKPQTDIQNGVNEFANWYNLFLNGNISLFHTIRD